MIALRPLRPGDEAIIADIHGRACRIVYAFYGWNFSETQVLAYCSERMAEWNWSAMAEVDGRPVGYIGMSGAHLDHIFVHPDAQRQGVGGALMNAALARSTPPVTLHAFERNTQACRFYEARGFRVIRSFVDEDTSETMRVYAWGAGDPASSDEVSRRPSP